MTTHTGSFAAMLVATLIISAAGQGRFDLDQHGRELGSHLATYSSCSVAAPSVSLHTAVFAAGSSFNSSSRCVRRLERPSRRLASSPEFELERRLHPTHAGNIHPHPDACITEMMVCVVPTQTTTNATSTTTTTTSTNTTTTTTTTSITTATSTNTTTTTTTTTVTTATSTNTTTTTSTTTVTTATSTNTTTTTSTTSITTATSTNTTTTTSTFYCPKCEPAKCNDADGKGNPTKSAAVCPPAYINNGATSTCSTAPGFPCDTSTPSSPDTSKCCVLRGTCGDKDGAGTGNDAVTCPTNYVPKAGTATTSCAGAACVTSTATSTDTDTCCVPKPTDGKATCGDADGAGTGTASASCPTGYYYDEGAKDKKCQGATCQVSEASSTDTSTCCKVGKKECVPEACGSSGFTSNCNSMAVDSSESSCKPVDDTMVSSCVPSTFAMKCPKDNIYANPPDFAQSAGLTCKLCGMTTTVTDKDVRKGTYNFVFTFGELQQQNGNIVPVAKYEVWAVDSAGRFLGAASANTGRLEVFTVKNAVTCCKENKYRVATQGTFGGNMAALKRFAIRPVSSSGNTLPFVAFTNELTDVSSGNAVVIDGSFAVDMSAADADLIEANPSAFKAIFALSFAKTAGVNADQVTIKQIYIDKVPQFKRRLQEGDARRLATKEVKVDYQVISESGAKIDVSSIKEADLKQNIEAEATSAGLAVTVTVSSITKPTSNTVSGSSSTSAPSGNGTVPTVGSTDDAPGRYFSALAALLALVAYKSQ